MNNQADPKRVVTGQVRLSYVHLINPRPARQAGEEPKFSVTLLIPKSDVATKQRVDAAIRAAVEEGVTSKWNGARPAQPAIPVYDGDGVRPSGEAFSEECKGHWVVTASSLQRPEIVDLNLNPIMQPTEIYSGMYARVSIRFFPYFASGKKGIGCGLGNVQKLADGEPLAGRQSAESDFGTPPPGVTAQQSPYQPPQPPQGAPAYQPQQPSWQPPVPPTPQWQQQPPQVPQWQQPAPQQPPQQQQWPPVQQQQEQQIDPITGRPVNGGIWGLPK